MGIETSKDNPVKKFVHAIVVSHNQLLRLEKWVFWTSLGASIVYLATGKWILAGVHLTACAFLLGIPQAELQVILKDKELIQQLLVELRELRDELQAQKA